MVVSAGDSLGGCVSKTARDSALFLCPVLAVVCGSCDELADVGSMEGCKTSSLGAAGLVYSRVTSSVGPTTLRERTSRVV